MPGQIGVMQAGHGQPLHDRRRLGSRLIEATQLRQRDELARRQPGLILDVFQVRLAARKPLWPLGRQGVGGVAPVREPAHRHEPPVYL